MVDWAKHSDWTNYPAEGFEHAITLNLYEVADGAELGDVIASVTETKLIQWRPEADTDNCTDGRWFDGEGCYNGFAFNLSFDLSGLGIAAPDELIYGIAYNTQTWGYSRSASQVPTTR